MARNPDYTIRDKHNNKIPIYKTPFTHNDYNYIINQDGCGEKFGIHQGNTGEIKFYDLGNGNIPNFTSLFSGDFNFDFFKSIKYLGFGVCFYWAYRLSTVKPKNPLRTTAKTEKFLAELFAKSKRPNPDVMHMGNGEGFKEAD